MDAVSVQPKTSAPTRTAEFDYSTAFARNLGLVTEEEQARLRRTCVALPGLGAVGGGHLQALARLGIGACRERRIPVVNAGPIGYGAALLVFLPDGISFDEYFRIEDGMTRAEQLLAQALGLAPGLVSDVDPSRVNFEKRQGPALATTCLLCAATATTEVLKLVTGRGTPAVAPCGVYFDPFRGRTVPLRPRPSLIRSLRGRVLRYAGFRRFPALREMHQHERAERVLQGERKVAAMGAEERRLLTRTGASTQLASHACITK